MRGVLVNDDKAVFRLGNDIGVGDLSARNAKRIAGAVGDGFVRFGGPAP